MTSPQSKPKRKWHFPTGDGDSALPSISLPEGVSMSGLLGPQDAPRGYAWTRLWRFAALLLHTGC
ncbi:hypothetical protein ONE63_002406 [Megalurothrips usitatus]|uniref:Uncharacterized protein n=1 Tax=Megalurothrips usitatus TaxID=439358 RepID=A0AAV7XAF2_9NEOP|nr:hypothetical protein ONE63_002406 [Megalurothrips usitatus]